MTTSTQEKGIILIQILIGRNDTFIGNASIGGLLELKMTIL